MFDGSKEYSIRRPHAAFAAGAVIGTLGGLIGLGGAEFRLPVLITIFALYPHRAVRFNLLVSLVTLTFAAVTRVNLETGLQLSGTWDVVAGMIVGGVVSAWIGAGLLTQIPKHTLMTIIAALLAVVGAMLIGEAAYGSSAMIALPQDPVARIPVAVVSGVVVGAVSSLLGVAGGEFIIPLLIFVFGLDIKTAGTLSLLISIPIVAIGVAKHLSTGHYRSKNVLVQLVLPMSAGTVLGAVSGGLLSTVAPVSGVKLTLGLILAASAIKLAHRNG